MVNSLLKKAMELLKNPLINDSFYRLNLGITKCYLLKCADGYLLIDAGYKHKFRKFIREIHRVGIKIVDIKYILLTHHHDDHAGFIAEMRTYTNARLIVHKESVTALRKGESENTMQPVNRRIKKLFPLFRLIHPDFKFPQVFLKEDDILIAGDDNELLRSIGIHGQILMTPGHSHDSMSVVMDDGSAFVGDLAMNFLRWTGIRYRPIYCENIEQVFLNWKKVVDAGALTIYPSHGKPFPAVKLITSKWYKLSQNQPDKKNESAEQQTDPLIR
ncbi:MAG: MBL fold metallo-hydrolase [Candidatus Neomarinimicrobiota bacterium]